MKARRRAERRGRNAELVAALWLMGKGYRILAQRARTPFGEVGLAAVKGRTLAIVEVKARKSIAVALDAVTPRQQERIARAGLALARRFRMAHAMVRLDLMIIRPWAAPVHVRNAWGRDQPM